MRKWVCCTLFFFYLSGTLPAAERAKTYEVATLENILYFDDASEQADRHKLDLYLPEGCDRYPVAMFVHGGGWRQGDKKFRNLYVRFGKSLARHGIGVAVPNYRLSPAVQHPEHVKDIARAFSWLYRNVAKYHGDPNRLFVCGHSAGGHLCALLATNDKYLRAEGLDLGIIKGVVPMSGVYKIPEDSILFNTVFGKDVTVRKDASPVEQVHEGLPPFLVIYADHEFMFCGKEGAEDFVKALQAKQCRARSMEVSPRNHMSLIVNATKDDDPVAQAFRSFVDECCQMPLKKP